MHASARWTSSACSRRFGLHFLTSLVAVFALVAPSHTAWSQSVTFSGYQTIIPTSVLNQPSALARDSAGSLYIADTGNDRVLKETVSGNSYTESTIGTSLSHPTGIAVDSSGAIYIADQNNHRVLKETPSGSAYTESTIGTGLTTPCSVAVDTSGNVYVGDTTDNVVYKETLASGAYTQTTAVALGSCALAVDASGNLFVADTAHSTVAKYQLSGGVYTLAGNFNGAGPAAISINSVGEMYISYPSLNQVNWFPPGALFFNSLPFSSPAAATSDGIGHIFALESGQLVDKTFNFADFRTTGVATTSNIKTLTFTFTTGGTIGAPVLLTQGVPSLDFKDAGTGTCTTNGTTHNYAVGDTCTVDVLFSPTEPGQRNGAVRIQTSSGTALISVYLTGVGQGPQLQFQKGTKTLVSLPSITNPYTVAADAAGNLYVVQAISANDPGNAVYKLTWNGTGYTQSTILTGLVYPVAVAVDGKGYVYVADQNAGRIYKLIPGYSASIAFFSLGQVESVAVDAAGNVYIGTNAYGVLKETLVPNQASTYAQSTIDASYYPFALAVDANQNVYASSPGGSGGTVKYTPTSGTYIKSTISTVQTYGLFVDANENVFGAAGFGGSLYEFTPVGGAYALRTLPYTASRLTGDGAGHLYTFDSAGLEKLDFVAPPSLSFASTPYGSTSSDSPNNVTVINAGNAPLTFPIPATGTNPAIASNFTLNGGTSGACPQLTSDSTSAGILTPNSTCILSVSFTPSALGSITGSLVLTDDSLNAASPAYTTQQIALTGTAVQSSTVVTWPAPAAITYGTALSATQLNATANVPGTFVYSPAIGTVLTAGSQTLTVTFTPTDTLNYTSSIKTVTLTVNQVTPAVTWTAPASIAYGAALSATQLNATGSVPGTFSYSPALGAVPSAGTQTLTATFTPTDAVNYAVVRKTVSLTVNKAPLSILANNFTRLYAAANPTFAGNMEGVVNGDVLTLTFSTAATSATPAGAYAIVPSVSGAAVGNYTVTTTNGSLTILPLSTTTTFALANSNLAITANVASATLTPTGSVSFYQGQTLLGTANLTNGVSTYTLSSVPSADSVLSARYSGDTNFSASNSASATVLTSSLGQINLTVSHSGTVNDTISLTGAPGLAATLQFSCTGLPAGTTCTFQPASITLTSAAETASTTVSIQTGLSASLNRPQLSHSMDPVLAGLFGLPGVWVLALRRKRLPRLTSLTTTLLAITLACLCSTVVGCAGPHQSTPAGTSTVQITASGSGITQNTSITLTVQ